MGGCVESNTSQRVNVHDRIYEWRKGGKKKRRQEEAKKSYKKVQLVWD